MELLHVVQHVGTIAELRDDTSSGWGIVALVAIALIPAFMLLDTFLWDSDIDWSFIGMVGAIILAPIAFIGQYAVSNGHERNVTEALEHNIAENFAVDDVEIDGGVRSFMHPSEDDEGPAVFTVKLYHEDTKGPTTHDMMYDEPHNLVVPLQSEAENITQYIQEGSDLDVALHQN